MPEATENPLPIKGQTKASEWKDLVVRYSLAFFHGRTPRPTLLKEHHILFFAFDASRPRRLISNPRRSKPSMTETASARTTSICCTASQ